MTGTAKTEAKEFKETYQLDVVSIPTAKPCLRDDRPDLVYATKLAKFRAVLREINDCFVRKQPVLVGTTTVEDSALISELLETQNVPHRVLNAKPEVAQREAEIIAQAGRPGAVTIATNMAGRGTDIILGGNAGLVAKLYARSVLAPLVDERLADFVAIADPESFYPCELSRSTKADMARAAESAAAEVRGDVFAEARERAALAGAARRQRLRETGYEATDDSETSSAPPALSPTAVLAIVDEFVASAINQKAGDFARATASVEAEYAAVAEKERENVRSIGGLFVLGTERHESRRIDLQLRGRSGRQGDAGTSVFVISLEDKMFNVFGADKMAQLRRAFDFVGDPDEPLSSDLLTKSLSSIQEKVESFYKEMRSNLFKYDKIIDAQRRVFYLRRARVLRADRDELAQLLSTYASDTAKDVVANMTFYASQQKDRVIDIASAATQQLQLMFPAAAACIDKEISILMQESLPNAAGLANGKVVRTDAFEAALTRGSASGVQAQIEDIDAKAESDEDLAAAVMRFMVLREFDRGWKEHLRELDLLREAVGFQAFSQKDPYQEWTIKSNDAFQQLSASIYRFSAITFLSLDPAVSLVQRQQSPVIPGLVQSPVPVIEDSSQPARLPPRKQDVAKTRESGPNRKARRTNKGGQRRPGKSRRRV